ncbi:MAG: Rrf2 family transcriptional regulator [Phycisphaeraceae bacterium]|nr:Rrf2 family transcriptional regulator [Phycisphaeraceae bacterium]
MICLSRNPDHPLTSQRLAAAAAVSPTYLKKVLHQLGRARLVQGRRGAGGGFVLGVPAHKLTVQAVVHAVDNGHVRAQRPPRQSGCVHAAGTCHRPIAELFARIQNLLAETTIADLTPPGPVPLQPAQIGTVIRGGCAVDR